MQYSFVLTAALLSTISSALPHGSDTLNSTASPSLEASSSGAPQPSASAPSTHKSGGEKYVVMFDESNPGIRDVLARLDLSPEHDDVHQVYNNSAFRGFTASMKSHCIDALNNMTDIAVMEKVVNVTTWSTTVRGGSPWGLQRISSAATVKGDPQQLDYSYAYDGAKLGSGVDIYVIDTGINTEHMVFEGRATTLFPKEGEGDRTDGDGHGTHVAGTAAGNVFGVASGANLFAIKVLDDKGSGTSDVTVNGINAAIANHDQRKNQPGFVGSVISMSWGLASDSPQPVIDNAIRRATAAGIHAVVAAGNEGSDSCRKSPSSAGGANGPAITVGSVGMSNKISSFSNTGACNDVFAPGEAIVSAWVGGDNVINQLDGTSMATPHVTGIVAYHMAQDAALAQDPAAMKKLLADQGLKGVIGGKANAGDQKILVNNGVAGEGMIGSKMRRRVVVETERPARRSPLNLSGLNSAVAGVMDLFRSKDARSVRLVLRSSPPELRLRY